MTDPDIQAAIQHATAKAESMYPRRTFSWPAKIAMIIIVCLIVGDSAIGVVNSAQIKRQQDCSVSKSADLTTVRNQDQTVIDNWINSITDELKNTKLTPQQFVQQAEALRQIYNQERANNSAERAKLNQTTCK